MTPADHDIMIRKLEGLRDSAVQAKNALRERVLTCGSSDEYMREVVSDCRSELDEEVSVRRAQIEALSALADFLDSHAQGHEAQRCFDQIELIEQCGDCCNHDK